MTARSAVGSVGFVSVALLFPGIGSVTPAGGVTVAVLEIAPTVPFATVPVMVRVADVPDVRSTVVAMSPLPDAAAQEPSLTATTHVQVADVTPAGRVSVTTAPVTSAGPLLAMTIAYVI